MAQPKAARTKKRVKKNIAEGIAHIHATFNNTIIMITDRQGNALAWATSGRRAEKVDARYTNGVLEVRLPMAEEAKPKPSEESPTPEPVPQPKPKHPTRSQGILAFREQLRVLGIGGIAGFFKSFGPALVIGHLVVEQECIAIALGKE